jgi:hypothetical protein
MDTGNAFDMLILPIIQCMAGIFATFPILHGMQVGIDHLRGGAGRVPLGRDHR